MYFNETNVVIATGDGRHGVRQVREAAGTQFGDLASRSAEEKRDCRQQEEERRQGPQRHNQVCHMVLNYIYFCESLTEIGFPKYLK